MVGFYYLWAGKTRKINLIIALTEARRTQRTTGEE
jgi:hypothetical protein